MGYKSVFISVNYGFYDKTDYKSL